MDVVHLNHPAHEIRRSQASLVKLRKLAEAKAERRDLLKIFGYAYVFARGAEGFKPDDSSSDPDAQDGERCRMK